MNYKVLTSILCVAVIGLAGCDSTKEQLGLNRKSPDEFSVVKRAPLSMPPNYNLRPPTPGAARPQEQAPAEQAQQSVFGAAVQTQEGTTSAEAALLQQAGATSADPAIRTKVDQESLEVDESKKPVAERLLGIVVEQEPSASVVDPKKESERIQQNIEQGKDITEGETPTIED